jgi:hypothetical protein
MDAQSTLERVMRESNAYLKEKPTRVPSADSPNRPTLEKLHRYAVSVYDRNPKTLFFSLEGVRYGIVFMGCRLAVMHMETHRILVRAPGGGDD